MLTASLAICAAIFDKDDILAAVLITSFTSSSAGTTLLTRPYKKLSNSVISI